MIKTVTLKGSELKVEGLGGFNAFVQNLGSLVMYASKNPGVSAGGDNVAEIPAGSGKLISSTNGTVYLLGTGRAEVTGLDGDSVIAAGGAAVAYSGSGGSQSVDSAALSEAMAELMTYADVGDEETLDTAKEYAESLVQNKADRSEIPEIPEISEIPTSLPANGGNADTVGGFTVGCNVPADAVFTDTVVDISGKVDAHNPTVTGAFSMNRKADIHVGYWSFTAGDECAGINACTFGAGRQSTASAELSHAEGWMCKTLGFCSYAFGNHVNTTATGRYSFATGILNTGSNFASFVCGKYSKEMTTGADKTSSIGDAFIIGNGTGTDSATTTASNAFRITYEGDVYGTKAYTSSGADYAEFIKPWFDGNPDSEDRVGYFVTIKDGKLRFAEADDYIVGITSGNPSIVGNGDEDWLGRWQRDEFDRIITEEGHFKANPDYDASKKYVERKDRPEWDYVGMIGVLPLRDDGTCKPGGFAKCGAGGVATAADEWECHKTFFVIERVSENVVKVEMR